MLPFLNLHTISKRSASTSNDVKIVNGTEATPNEYPSIVTLRVNGTSFCGGTIVGQRWIVTASHCLVSKRWCLPNQTIAAGKHNLQVTEVSEQTVEVVGTILHPGFVPPYCTASLVISYTNARLGYCGAGETFSTAGRMQSLDRRPNRNGTPCLVCLYSSSVKLADWPISFSGHGVDE
ncbi:unnamed protein product [Allacma fusca]|uniref:Peptidase S1 domain-containing protein n=1 Tax=Allacma fusca TaxID=39272 RepID=A0A8J2KML8_9HEXA|nr:unnamed protein product [Allacma fusca]